MRPLIILYTFPVYTTSMSALWSTDHEYITVDIPIAFRLCEVGEILSKSECQLCEDSYSFTSNTLCNLCPKLAESCRGASIVLPVNYWRRSDNSVNIMQCPLDGACKGGTNVGNSSCNIGYSGLLCSVCDNRYYPSSGKCEPCPNKGLDRNQLISLGVILIVMLLALLVLFIRYMVRMGVDDLKFMASVISGAEMKSYNDKHRNEQTRMNSMQTIPRAMDIKDQQIHSSHQDNKLMNRLRLKTLIVTRAKIIISTFQVLTICPLNFLYIFPPYFRALMENLAFINLDIFRLVQPRCIGDFGHIEAMKVITLIPFGITFIGIIAMLLTMKHAYETLPKRSDGLMQRFQEIRLQYFSYLLMLLFVVVPPVSYQVFLTLQCRDLDPYHKLPTREVYMVADMSVRCDSSRYTKGRWWAIAMVIVYPVGIPLLYFWLLCRCRYRIQHKQEIEEMLSSKFMKHRASVIGIAIP